jgi:hypothetical protein
MKISKNQKICGTCACAENPLGLRCALMRLTAAICKQTHTENLSKSKNSSYFSSFFSVYCLFYFTVAQSPKNFSYTRQESTAHLSDAAKEGRKMHFVDFTLNQKFRSGVSLGDH